jgi:phage baseplate assembly protein V
MDLLDFVRDARGMITIGIVQSVDDTGQAQTVTVKTHDGAIRADVEVIMPFGHSSVPTLDGAICLVFAIGADPANLRALPLANPSSRYGAQNAGESTLYAADGTRVSARTGGKLELFGGNSIEAKTKALTLTATTSATITTPELTISGGVAITGTVSVTGAVTINGNVATSGTLTNNDVDVGSAHAHTDVQRGGEETGPPVS